jgi:hypothetical protein
LRRILSTNTFEVEQVWCEVSRQSSDKKILLGCIYRPPLNARTADDKLKHIDTAMAINKSIAIAARSVEDGQYSGLCITGDFNFPDVHWTDEIVMNRGKPDGLAGSFLDVLDNFSLHQAVRSPTFFPANNTPTNVLDLIICERCERVDIHEVGAPLGSAHQGHAVIEFSLNLNSSKRTVDFISSTLCYKKGNYSGMRSDLRSMNWEAEFNLQNIEDVYNRFCLFYNRLYSIHIPKKKHIAHSQKPPLMTTELIRLDNKRRLLFVSNLRTNWKSASNVRIYRRTLKELTKKSKIAIISFERRLAFNKDPKQLFSYVRRRNTVDTNIAALTTTTGSIVTSPQEMANQLNNQFASVFQTESGDLPQLSLSHELTSVLGNVLFSELDIAERLSSLDTSKSIDLDGIHPHVLRECAEELAKPLAMIWYLSRNSNL